MWIKLGLILSVKSSSWNRLNCKLQRLWSSRKWEYLVCAGLFRRTTHSQSMVDISNQTRAFNSTVDAASDVSRADALCRRFRFCNWTFERDFVPKRMRLPSDYGGGRFATRNAFCRPELYKSNFAHSSIHTSWWLARWCLFGHAQWQGVCKLRRISEARTTRTFLFGKELGRMRSMFSVNVQHKAEDVAARCSSLASISSSGVCAFDIITLSVTHLLVHHECTVVSLHTVCLALPVADVILHHSTSRKPQGHLMTIIEDVCIQDIASYAAMNSLDLVKAGRVQALHPESTQLQVSGVRDLGFLYSDCII